MITSNKRAKQLSMFATERLIRNTAQENKFAHVLDGLGIVYQQQIPMLLPGTGIMHYIDFLIDPERTNVVWEIDDSRHWSKFARHDLDAMLAEEHQLRDRLVTWRSNEWVTHLTVAQIADAVLRVLNRVAAARGLKQNCFLPLRYALPCQDPANSNMVVDEDSTGD